MGPTDAFHHVTVLLRETVESLGEIQGATVVDCTLGGGGHTALLLEKVGPSGRVIAFDKDPDALAAAKMRFEKALSLGQLIIVDDSFSNLQSHIHRLGLFRTVDGIIADIGVSSHQLDMAERGFSFSNDGPLDMRMNARTGMSAAEFVNSAEEEEIANVIYQFGEEHKSRQIAKIICQRRSIKPFQTTKDLADVIGQARLWKGKSKKHPATKTFQALRIFINDELGELKTLCHDAFDALKIGGRLSIISFHSLEDRLVKESFLSYTGRTKMQNLPRNLPLTQAQLDAMIQKSGLIVGDFPVDPTEGEVATNPRARSAKLRTIEKTNHLN
jgi:16S rRNA (cytosine1402-N4)-methyltransferase